MPLHRMKADKVFLHRDCEGCSICGTQPCVEIQYLDEVFDLDHGAGIDRRVIRLCQSCIEEAAAALLVSQNLVNPEGGAA